MGLRAALLALVLAATAAFVVGVAVERGSGEAGHHDTASPAATGKAAAGGEAHAESGGESEAVHAAEGAAGAPTGTETHAELRPMGINIEAWPFVIAAVLASLVLAAVGWLRPQTPALLAAVAIAMLAFAALDIREVAHQIDIDKDGVAVLAGAVAVLHLAAAVAAAAMASRAWRPHGGARGQAGTMAA
jgi:hypothetical protein